MRNYLDSHRFRLGYPAVYEKWALAEGLLWGDDSSEQLSTVGHHCREALQEFVSVLVQRYQPAGIETDPQRTINRFQAVLRAAEATQGTTEVEFLKSLVDYWKALNDLVQRQEHAGQREGRRVGLEDGRRVVFQTMCVMYEVDRVLNSTTERKV